MISPSEGGRQILVPRYVSQYADDMWHICMSDDRLQTGAIVTLEALCGHWCYGMLTRLTSRELRLPKLTVRFCNACNTQFKARARELDPHGVFRRSRHLTS